MYLHTVEKGNGPALVLLHGNFGDAFDWSPVLDPLAEQFRVLAIELPGCGGSDKPDSAYDASFFAEAVEEFFEARGLGRCSVVGHSLGGQVAMAFGLTYPHRIERLVLVDSGGFIRYPEAQLALLQARFTEPVLRNLTPEQVRAMFSALFVELTPECAAYERNRSSNSSAKTGRKWLTWLRGRSVSTRISVCCRTWIGSSGQRCLFGASKTGWCRLPWRRRCCPFCRTRYCG